MKRIRHLLGRWTDVSIWVKSILLMGIMLVSLWTLVILATQQLRGFSAESDVIMNEYMDITGFMNAFSAENVALETYIRPSLSVNALEDYIELQETRYSGRIHTEIRIEPGLERVTVPKFILQPLVENSMLHGLKECISDGEIRVRARRVGADVVITVTDNGCGFDTRHPHTGNGKRRSVGMANIAERMELNGGEFRIFSRIGWGTCAKIIIKGEMKA